MEEEQSFTDWCGDQREVTAGMTVTGDRLVWYDNDAYSPEEARRLARELLAAAASVERSFFMIRGGAA